MANNRRDNNSPVREMDVNFLLNQAILAKRVRETVWSPRFSTEVKRRVIESHLSQEGVAQECGISSSTLSKCIRCLMPWRLTDVLSISRFLKIDPRVTVLADAREMDTDLEHLLTEMLDLPETDLIG